VPLTQTWPAAHAVLQSPQCLESDIVSTQAPLHATRPDGHVHAPFRQTRPPVQAWPQAPQLNGSVLVFAHTPLQFVRPAWHVVAHAPLTHT